MGNFSGREEGENESLENFVPGHPSGRTMSGPSRFESANFKVADNERRLMDTAGGDAMEVEEGGEEEDDGEELIPTVFRWEHGGRQVYITGTFNNWENQIPMHRSGNDFTYIHNLTKGKHAFKFIVDDEWRFAPDQQTVADIEGRINNFIDVSDFKPYTGDEEFQTQLGKESQEVYSTWMPDLDEYTKEPPPLPPHLRHIILNKPGLAPPRTLPSGGHPPGAPANPGATNPQSTPGQPPQAAPVRDPAALPTPQHVALNHLYCTAIKDGMMVLGMTQRYKTKFVTTVYYSTMPST
mmetsp:Transcript_4929/g.6497  ORF Transcript_4929/g.6497 Transcript_4929/m.6497 type:complete len:295 (-) Transcript_4929:259-1143(-)